MNPSKMDCRDRRWVREPVERRRVSCDAVEEGSCGKERCTACDGAGSWGLGRTHDQTPSGLHQWYLALVSSMSHPDDSAVVCACELKK